LAHHLGEGFVVGLELLQQPVALRVRKGVACPSVPAVDMNRTPDIQPQGFLQPHELGSWIGKEHLGIEDVDAVSPERPDVTLELG
jgi:hypothetical protein